MSTIFWQGVEVVDQVIALVEEPTAHLSRKFADHAATRDLQESQLAAQRKVIDEYISSHRPKLAKRATAAMKRKRAPASPAKQGKQRGAALSAPIVEAVEEAKAAMSQKAAPSSATPIKTTEQKQLALRFAWDRMD